MTHPSYMRHPSPDHASSLAGPRGAEGMSLPFEQLSDPISKGFVPVPSGMETTDDCELPAFWLDMCTDIPTGDAEYTNLQVNPERWTGYNGCVPPVSVRPRAA